MQPQVTRRRRRRRGAIATKAAIVRAIEAVRAAGLPVCSVSVDGRRVDVRTVGALDEAEPSFPPKPLPVL